MHTMSNQQLATSHPQKHWSITWEALAGPGGGEGGGTGLEQKLA